MAKVFKFFRESVSELKRVQWPTRQDVWASVKVVVVSTILFAVILGLLDLAFTQLFRVIVG